MNFTQTYNSTYHAEVDANLSEDGVTALAKRVARADARAFLHQCVGRTDRDAAVRKLREKFGDRFRDDQPAVDTINV